MFDCNWAQTLTKYDCRSLVAIDGSPCLEIGTPFSLPDGSAINIYLKPEAQFIRISDNADTMFQLGGLGLDVWNGAVKTSLSKLLGKHKVQLSPQGEVFLLTSNDNSAMGFAVAITAILQLANWAADKLNERSPTIDLIAEVEPYLIARNPTAEFKKKFHVKGVSQSDHVFDFLQGCEIIDVLTPWPASTGGAMRKAGDVQNGPMGELFQPLFIVDDRTEPDKAFNEIEILGSITRAMPLTSLMSPPLH